jgi:hypothetical protein
MRIGIVVDDQMDSFDVPVRRLRQIGLDHDGDNPAVFGDNGHIEADVPAAYGTPT